MGLVFDSTTQVQPNQPQAAPRGEQHLKDMISAFETTSTTLRGQTRRLALDGLNNLYRSKAYRDWIKSMRDAGQIDPSVVRKMQQELSRWRHHPRTPYQKAWRSQWP